MIFKWNCGECAQHGTVEITWPFSPSRLAGLVSHEHRRGRKRRGRPCEDDKLEIAPLDLAEPVPLLKGSHPVVLYFGKLQERDEFIKICRHAKPGLRAEKL